MMKKNLDQIGQAVCNTFLVVMTALFRNLKLSFYQFIAWCMSSGVRYERKVEAIKFEHT